MVGTGEFESPTSSMSTRRSNQLSYAPTASHKTAMLVGSAMIPKPADEARLEAGGAPPLFISGFADWETFENHGMRLN